MTDQIMPPANPNNLPEDLYDKIKAIQALATTYNFLDNPVSLLSHHKAATVKHCLDFLRQLYENVKADALAHPDAPKATELDQFRPASPATLSVVKSEEVTDGEA